MASQTILWIPLPGGFVDAARTRARLSVFVSPQLQPDGDGTLAAFDFRDWPGRLVSGGLTFAVQLAGRTIEAGIASAPESRLWTALFAPDTFVRSHERVRMSPVFGTYPAARLHDRLRAGYRQVGVTSPVVPAAPGAIAAAFSDVHRALTSPAVRASTGATERARLAGEILNASRREVATLGDRLVDLAQGEVERRRVRNEPLEFVPIVPPHDDAVSAFEQFVMFQRQPTGSVRRTRTDPDIRHDFHQLVTSLGEYPELMRLLGLLITIELDAAEIPVATLDRPGLLRVRPTFATPLSVETRHVAPATAYAFVRERLFTAAPDPGGTAARESVAGLLDLRLQDAEDGEPQFQILQVDLETAAQRMLDLLTGLPVDLAPTDDSPATRADHGIPPLRSGGISIVRHGHARFLHDAIATGQRKVADLLSGVDVALFAEDLIRGYRIDVLDNVSNEWHSLHHRSGTYEFLSLTESRTLVDEGSTQPCFVQPVSATGEPPSSQPDPEAPNYISESLFLWNGWGLSAPRPGNPLPQPEKPPPPPPAPGMAPPPPPPPPPTLPLKTTFKAVGRSLPRLRFGRAYSLRGRMVDLGGQSVSSDEATNIIAGIAPAPVLPAGGDAFRFLRFEVVGAPAVVARSKLADGESLDRLVVRSPGTLGDRQERHIAPPKAWPMMAEMHGLFDSAIGTGNNMKDTLALAGRAEAAFADGPHPEQRLELPYLPDPLAAGVTFCDLPGVPAGTIGRVGGGALEFTPIPPPVAAAAQIRSLVLIDFGPSSSWPNLLPFRLRVAGGTAAPQWDEAARVLTVFVAEAAVSTVRMSCHLRDLKDVSLLGMATWIQHGMDPAGGAVDAFRQQTLLGLSWMVTPFRQLTLVHAVQQPVAAPEIVSFPQPIKLVDHTFVYVRGKVQVHGASTGRLELTAEWTEPGDDLDSPKTPPKPRRLQAHVFPSPFHLSASGAQPVHPGSIPEAVFDAATNTVEYLAPRIEQFDARFHQLSQMLTALKRSARKQADDAQPPRPSLVAVIELLDVESIEAVVQRSPFLSQWSRMAELADMLRDQLQRIFAEEPHPGEPEDHQLAPLPSKVRSDLEQMMGTATQIITKVKEFLTGLFRGRHEFGDTKHRRVTYRAVGTSRFADAFPAPPGGTIDLTATSAPVEVNVLSSAAPLPPGVRHVIPTFAWTRSAPDAPRREHHRQGGGLRVYLERPWFSSGEGEMLAVVLGPDPSTPGFDRMAPYVSRCGRDPLWPSSPPPNALRPEHFRNPAVVRERVRPQDADAPLSVTLVAYPVKYDDDGQCFCDIEMDAGASYFPFVRLALARLQPQSIPTLEMSRVTRADFAQLAPDRAVTIVLRAAGVFDVVVSGPTHTLPNGFTGIPGTNVQVTVQTRIPGTTDDAGWLPANEPVVIPETLPAGSGFLWKGQVRMPVGAGAGQFRLLIKEFELHRVMVGGLLGADFDPVGRLVFAESVEL